MKDTRLNDDAAIYSKREPQSEKEKWSNLSRSEKKQYFKDYYLKILLVVAISGVFLIYILYTVLSPTPENILNLSIVSGFMEDETTEALTTELSELLAMDPKTQKIYIDTSLYIDENNISETTIASEQKLSVYVYSGEIDLLIAERDLFLRYAKSGFFTNLTEALPSNIYNRVCDHLVMTIADDIDTEEAPYGFSIAGYKRFNELNTIMKDPVIGIIGNTKNEENALSVIEWFIEE